MYKNRIMKPVKNCFKNGQEDKIVIEGENLIMEMS
jgi:hypothetical protein